MTRSPFVRSLFPLLLAAVTVAQAKPAPAVASPKIAVLGASASQGFELGVFLGDDATAKQRIAKTLGREPDAAEFTARTHSIGLAALLTELRGADTPAIVDGADQWMFIDPKGAATKQLRKAREEKAELVLALDFVFWFGYGRVAEKDAPAIAAARVARLQSALAQLAAWLDESDDCQVVLGDFPDCRDASKEMITDSMRPDTATLAQLNTTLRAWAKDRANVRIFPLGELLDGMRAGKVAGSEPGRTMTEAEALQFDRLHPTRHGMVVLARELVAFVQKEFPGLHPLATPESIAKRLAARS